ncbi:MAG: DUF4389 domain-containing protein [Acidimicrobiales bacterium]|nr:DUF4389 domain-containing protein [Acidimicrobiales bacterium]
MEPRTDLKLDAPLEMANWRPVVHWLLVLPHMIIAGALSSLGSAVALVSWFIIVFTGELPDGLAKLQCLVIRYQARAYSYLLWLREPYPAFDFSMTEDEPGGDPLSVTIRPQLTDRNRLTVGLRFIWVIPIAIFLALVILVGYVVAFVGFFVVLFTGRWPEGLRDFLVGVMRVGTRVTAYCYLLDDDYPPFSLD